MQALKFVLVSAVALVGLSVLVKAGGYGRPHIPHYPIQQPNIYTVVRPPPIQRYAVVPVGGIGGFGGGFGGGLGGVGVGGGLGGFGGNGLFFLIIIIVFVFILLGSDLFEED